MYPQHFLRRNTATIGCRVDDRIVTRILSDKLAVNKTYRNPIVTCIVVPYVNFHFNIVAVKVVRRGSRYGITLPYNGFGHHVIIGVDGDRRLFRHFKSVV